MAAGVPSEGDSFSDTSDPEVLNARMRLDFVDWWQAAALERPWVRLRTRRSGEPFQGWWDLGTKWDPACGRPPVIEVAGLAPTGGPRIEVPEPVDTVGWWILSRVDVESARRWVDVGVTNPFDTRAWGTALGLFLPSELGCPPLAKPQRGWWVPTDQGYGILARLVAAGVGCHALWGPDCRHHLAQHAPDVLDLLAG